MNSTKTKRHTRTAPAPEKANIKTRAKRKANAARDQVSEGAAQAKESTQPAVQQAIHKAGGKVVPVARQVTDRVAPHRGKVASAMLAGMVALVVGRRRHERRQA